MVNRFLDHLEEWIITFLIGAATTIIFVAVVHRYATGFATGAFQDLLLKIDLSWAQELTIYMFVWMAKFGAAYGVRTGIHVGVDVAINAIERPHPRLVHHLRTARRRAVHRDHRQLRRALRLGADAHRSGVGRPRAAEVDRLPCIPLGSYLMCYRFLQVAWRFHKTGDLPHADHGHVEGLDKEAEVEWAVMPSDLHPAPVKPGAQP